MSEASDLAKNILNYHGANTAYLAALSKARCMGLSPEQIAQIQPFPPKVILLNNQSQTDNSSLQPQNSLLKKGAILATLLGSGAGLGYLGKDLISNFFQEKPVIEQKEPVIAPVNPLGNLGVEIF